MASFTPNLPGLGWDAAARIAVAAIDGPAAGPRGHRHARGRPRHERGQHGEAAVGPQARAVGSREGRSQGPAGPRGAASCRRRGRCRARAPDRRAGPPRSRASRPGRWTTRPQRRRAGPPPASARPGARARGCRGWPAGRCRRPSLARGRGGWRATPRTRPGSRQPPPLPSERQPRGWPRPAPCAATRASRPAPAPGWAWARSPARCPAECRCGSVIAPGDEVDRRGDRQGHLSEQQLVDDRGEAKDRQEHERPDRAAPRPASR